MGDQQNLATDSNYKSCCCFLDTNKNLNNNNNCNNNNNTNINNLNDTNSNSSSSFSSTNSNNTTNNNALSIVPNPSAADPLTSLNSIKSEKEKPLLSITSSDSDSQLQWLHFDDTKVKSLTNLEFQRKIVDSSFDSPYILFYVKN